MADVIYVDPYKLGTLTSLIELCKGIEKYEGKLKLMVSSCDVESNEGLFTDVCIGLRIDYMQIKAISNVENGTKLMRLDEIIKNANSVKK